MTSFLPVKTSRFQIGEQGFVVSSKRRSFVPKAAGETAASRVLSSRAGLADGFGSIRNFYLPEFRT